MSAAQEQEKPSTSTATHKFDSSNVEWKPFITEGCYYRILNVDVPAKTADMLVKFDPHGLCLYHRHAAVVATLVLEGELRIREQTPDGEVLKIKPAGSYSVGGRDEVHIEGGGEEGAIVFFNMRTDTDVIYELLDSDLKLRRAITVADFDREWRQFWPEKASA